jgi:SsrA-binding protein
VTAVEKGGVKIVCKNQRAYHEYFVLEKFEAGIELFGTEVKSIRAGTVNLKEAWCAVEDGQLIVKQMHISPYEKGNIFNKDPMREKRLLMHKREILYLYGKVRRDGYTIVPLSVYFKNSRVKVEVGLCKGKQLHDKRETAAKRDAEREMDRAKKSFNRY